MTAEPMEVSSTEVTTYPHVKQKQNEGSLILSDTLSFQPAANAAPSNSIAWASIAKHQVSPASHSKALLKIILKDGKSVTFRFENRQELERIRKDISARLNATRTTPTSTSITSNGNKKRAFSQLQTTFGEMDKTAVAVTRSALLAANATLRDQHRYLVTETQTVSEEDFWETHKSLVEEEYAKISGATRAGTSSLLQSHLPLQGKVTLGVEEMRQIFVLYPAVHKAYEERVPLELSDEQFWEEYLKSEFFHRDRGRLGTTAKNHGDAKLNKRKQQEMGGAAATKLTAEEEDARAAAIATDDFFSRYDAKLKEAAAAPPPDGQNSAQSKSRKWGTRLAVGQFDLASTVETERGHLLEGPRDEYPPNADDDGKGARVIEKFNRHSFMVLHPDDAVAGSNLTEVARKSALQDTDAYEVANPLGGCDAEMRRLVKYANAPEEDANHVLATGIDEDDYEALTLKNVEAYYSASHKTKNATANKETEEEELKRKAVFAKAMANKMRNLAAPYLAAKENAIAATTQATPSLPPSTLGRELLAALTNKMAADAQTEADALAVVDALPEAFKKRLNTYFRRSSELLRHFYGLRKLEAQGNYQNSQKLGRIVQGLEAVYREMEAMRKELPQTEAGEMMRKMCLPIMDQVSALLEILVSLCTLVQYFTNPVFSTCRSWIGPFSSIATAMAEQEDSSLSRIYRFVDVCFR